MRRRGVSRFWVDTVTVETYKGAGSAGDIFVAPVVLAPGTDATDGCLVEDGSHLIRNAQGEQVVSMGIVFCDIANAPLFAVNSRVTTPTRTARVITASTNSAPGLGLPEHLEVHLT